MTYFRIPGKCLGSWETLAITDFPITTGSDAALAGKVITSDPNLHLHGKKAKWNFTASGGSTNNIVNSGDYLEYDITNAGNLVGKTITINYT